MDAAEISAVIGEVLPISEIEALLSCGQSSEEVIDQYFEGSIPSDSSSLRSALPVSA